MPVFTAIGLAVGFGATAAFAGGVAATALVGAGLFAAGGGFDSDVPDTRISAPSTDTGALTAAETQTAAKKRAFRSGVLFTSPTGLDSTGKVASAKLR